MRLLEAARAEGVVRIEIEDELRREDDLAARLEAAFGLDLAVVVPEPGALARAGAATLPLVLRRADLVGVAWGETLSALVGELAPQAERHDVVQICGAIPGLATGTGPSEVAVRLAERLGGSVSLLPAPARPATLDELLDDETIRPTLELFDQIQVALVGIGPHGSGGGHVLVHVFGPDGSVLDPEPALALSLEGLRRARTVAVAGGEAKHEAILAVLRGTDPLRARDRRGVCAARTGVGMNGKVVLVTGAAGGIGSAVVRAFEEAGATVIGVDRDDGDLTHEPDVARIFAAPDRLDVVFNGAGISGRSLGDGPTDECTEAGWDAVLDGNLKSVFLCCKHAIPRLREAGGGAIVNLSSVLGLVGGDADFATHAYAASKAGIIGLTRAIAVHYAPEGIRCNAIAPGLIATPMSARAQADERIRARLAELQPLTGELGRPEDVAAAALYLATAEFVTGTILPVDGGWTAR